MIIDSISLKGWRSYDHEGVTLENLKAINLIIGPNNSGKSNLAKYFVYLKNIVGHNGFNTGLVELKSTVEEGETWKWERNDITCEVGISKENPGINKEVFYKPNAYDITLICRHMVAKEETTLNYSVNKNSLYTDNSQIIVNLDPQHTVDIDRQVDGFRDGPICWQSFLDSLIFVDPIRHHDRSSENEKNFYFDGAKIIGELDRLFKDNSQRSKWRSYKNKIKEWLSDILSEDVEGIEISDNNIRLDFKSGLIFSLDDLGTGVSQLVMLLSHLWLNKDKNLNVFLEEPEANLHPESVIKLVKIFEQELKNHKFFITSHSPSLIDCINDKWAVFRTVKNTKGSSEITQNDNVIKYYQTLDDLGVKASQILQANTVLWVEGPSDRIYLKKWIESESNNELVEGEDFSFLFFGGTNLASFTAVDDDNEQLINMLSTSRKAALITDSDCKSQVDKDGLAYKGTLESMLSRVSKSNRKVQSNGKSLRDYFHIWITEGREVENYIPKDLLFDVLSNNKFKRTRIGPKGKIRQLKLAVEPTNFTFNKFDSFDVAISSAYTYDDDTKLNNGDRSNIAKGYAGKKVQIAKSIVDKWDKHTTDVYQLKGEIIKLVDFIRS
ncbi:hypothetical protein GCM10009111_07460 [Colwellia asteriadis]|uniref:Endonuclease GajA/Old nuclease/RecF-like AAA domain-containing protein n=1 Tax=Colwellia asteriadis TaxID=517723 RepID=A0ABN1L407_9GAMM